jgi:hypothetical protein
MTNEVGVRDDTSCSTEEAAERNENTDQDEGDLA